MRNRLKDNFFPYYDNYAGICIRVRVFKANLGYISVDAFIEELWKVFSTLQFRYL